MLPQISPLKQILAVVLLGVTGAAHAEDCRNIEYAELKDMTYADIDQEVQIDKIIAKGFKGETAMKCYDQIERLVMYGFNRRNREDAAKKAAASNATPKTE